MILVVLILTTEGLRFFTNFDRYLGSLDCEYELAVVRINNDRKERINKLNLALRINTVKSP